MSDIALVQPPLEDFYLTGKRTVPYGLLALAAALEKRGFSVTLVDALATAKNKIIPRPSAMDYLEPHFGRPDRSPFALFHHYRHFGYSFAHVAELVSRSGAFLVGISSLFTPYHEAALETARIIKKRLPTCKIVVGGHHATVLPEAVMACAAVDFVLRGEAENSLPRLAALVRQDRETAEEALSAIPGLVWRRPTGVIEPAAPAVVDDLDAQPPPAVHLLKSSFYRRHGRAGAVIVASRGCPLRCSYCAVSAAGGPPYRRRSLAGVMVEIERAICGQGAGFIDFEDENLSLDRGWFMELLAALARLRRDHVFELRAMNGLFPPSLDEPMIAAMAAAGFRTLNLAVGSFAPEQLARFRRPDVGRAHDRVLELCRDQGLEAVSYLIAGAPGQAALVTLSDLLHLLPQPTLAGLSIYYPAPGSLDYERAAAGGLLPSRYALLRSTALPLDQPQCRRLESVTLLRLSRIINFIKSLRNLGQPLPAPEPYSSPAAVLELSADDRPEGGRRLLSWFLADGVIRGVTPAGEVYAHPTAIHLTRRLIEAIAKTGS